MDFSSIFAQHRTRNIFFALLSFTYAFVIYVLTVAPTTPFWDPAEYIAISNTLQIAHPPGSPFFALFGRVISMFMPVDYVAWSVNMISVIASSFTIMLLYLIIVRLVEEWKGPADSMDFADLTGLYGGGLTGAFVFTVTHTQWFNAVEAEMYATSMFFTALVVWMALRWSAEHDQPYSERWLVLIAYIFGVGTGIHLLNLLALFFVAMIVYFKKKNFTLVSFVTMGGIAIVSFLFIYPFTIINLPDMAGRIGNVTYGLIGPVTFILFIAGAVAFGVYYTHKNGHRLANTVCLAYMMILIGYSSYALVIIRSQAAPPIDENDPSTAESFVSYLSRDQYGQSPLLMGNTFDNRTGSIDRDTEKLFPRRHSTQPLHLQYYGNFDSDLEFFWEYQVNHMYIRYFNWNFIGREADIQDTGWYSGLSESRYDNNPANSGYFYLPFLLGLFGLLFHFRNDWKRALSVLALFALTGLAIIVYLNQPPSEPRERDYAYVGSFFAYAIWIGLGATGIIELLKQSFGNNKMILYGSLAAVFLAVPGWMTIQNWPSHDRSERYIARDYAYNLLQSLEKNAILFTNGDNDTFPLWYIQEVEGVRTDVRVVNLSLLNTDWYIKQLRDRQTHESLPLPIDLTDEEIARMTSQLELHQPGEYSIPVDKELLHSVFETSPAQIEDTTNQFMAGQSYLETLEITPVLQNQIQMAVPYSVPVDSLDDEVTWSLQGRSAGSDAQGNPRFYLQTQDKMILEILANNQWLRPVYFANTVARSGQIGLENYFQFEGKAFRIVPKRRDVGPFGYVDTEIHADRLSKFEFNNWDSPTAYFDENIRRMLGNYRYSFMQLADAYIQEGDTESAAHWLKYGEDKIPFRDIEHDWTIATFYAYRYLLTGEDLRAKNLAFFISEKLNHDLEYNMRDLDDLETRLTSLEEEAQQARARAQSGKEQQIRAQQQRLSRQRESVVENISYSVQRLTILQHIFFETDDEETAELLRLQVNDLTQGRLQLPSTAEESNEQISNFGIGI